MASINPTQLTPPRVPLIDDRTGAISREWYRFFLSLLTATQDNQQNTNISPDTNSLLATYDAMLASVAQASETMPDAASAVTSLQSAFNSLAQEVQTSTSDLTGSLQQQIDNVFTSSSTQPRNELGTISYLQQDNVPWVTFSNVPSNVPPTIGTTFWDGGTTLNIQMTANVIGRVNETEFIYVKASAAITKGQLCYHTGSVGSSGVITAAPTPLALADPNQIIGVAAETIALNGFGLIQISGTLRGFNTTGSSVGETWADGDPLYYNPAYVGSLTKTKPSAPNQKTYIGEVINAGSGGSGSIHIRIVPGSILGGTDSNVQFGTLVNSDLIQYDSALQYWKNVAPSAISVGTATNLAGGAANRIAYQTAPGTTSFIVAPTTANTFLEWSGSAFQWSSNPLGSVTSVSVVSANGLAGTVANPTTTPAITLSTTVTGIVKGNGTALSAAIAGTDYVAPGAITTSGLTMATARLLGRTTASTGAVEEISVAGGLTLTGSVLTGTSGTVTSVSGTGTVNGITLTGTVTSSGSLTLGGTLSNVSLTTQVTGTLPIANGGTNATTASGARTSLGATTVGSNFFTLTNPSAITFPRINADNSVSALDAATFRTAIGAGTGNGSVTSVDVSGGTTGLTTSGGPITGSGTITLAGTLVAANGGTGQSSYTIGDILYASGTTALSKLADVATGNALISGGVGVAPSYGKIGLTTHISGTLAVGNGGTGATTLTSSYLLKGNGTSAVTASVVYDDATSIGVGAAPSAWGGGYKAVQVNTRGALSSNNSNATAFSHNHYWDGSNNRYIATGTANLNLIFDNQFRWYTAPSGTAGNVISYTERMRVQEDGKFLCLGIYDNTVGATNRDVYVDNTGLVGYVASIRASKTNIADITDTSWLDALRPVTFNYRKRDEDGAYTDEAETPLEYGLIAEEVEKINPELVFYDKTETGPELRGVSYSKLIIPLLKELQSLRARVAVLEGE